jgi:RNA polymerase sigma factor (sigma-70 family)
VTELDLLKKANPKAIEQVYRTHRNAFVAFGYKYGLAEDELLDIYQDTIIAFIENLRKGHLDNLQAEVKTYLFSIGKYLIFSRLKTKDNLKESVEELPETFVWEELEDDKEALFAEMAVGLKQLGEQCYKILTLFYYEEKKLDEIQKILNYDQKDVLKSQKSRCLSHLKKLLKK